MAASFFKGSIEHGHDFRCHSYTKIGLLSWLSFDPDTS